MNRIYLGKFVSTHGIKGELKLVSDFDKRELVYQKGFSLYVGDVEYKILSTRPHKQYELVLLDGFDNINDVLFLVGASVYINRDDLMLDTQDYLLEDLIGATIKDGDLILGSVSEVLKSVNNNLIRVKNDAGEFLIPLIDNYVVSFDKDLKILYTKNAQSLIIK